MRAYDIKHEKNPLRRLIGQQVLPRIRKEVAVKKRLQPTGPGAATVDRAKARMCVTCKGNEPTTLPKAKPI